jgi:serine/threonine-protein kinase
MVGECIGNYQIVQRLGEGGMAAVYLATHPELGRRVAVKVLNPDLARSDQMVQRFFNEARAASGIGHRGIVEVFDLGTLPSGAPYIVMEHLDGESLAERMTRSGRLPLEVAAEIAGQAASVMVAAHARGIVHRDLKPDNLFLVPDPLFPGRELVKVLDFGIAKLAQRPADRGEQRTRTGVILGTPRYMSPEQCRESRDVDHRTDVYSLGVVLYEMLAGAPPFVSGSWGELAHMHIGVMPPALKTHMPDVPANVADIVHRALEKDPAARFQSMGELETALRAAVAPRAAVSPASAAAPASVDEQVNATARGRAPAAGSTMRLEEPPPSARARPPRRTTLAGAASEVLRDPDRPSRAGRLAPALVVAAAAAVVAIVGSLALRRTPPAVTTTTATTAAPAPAPVVVAPAVAAPPAPIVEPAPPAPPPPVVDRPLQPAEGALASQPAARPAPAKPARRRRSLAPAKPAAPVPPPVAARPREPQKI